jgi:hypothetical protein
LFIYPTKLEEKRRECQKPSKEARTEALRCLGYPDIGKLSEALCRLSYGLSGGIWVWG